MYFLSYLNYWPELVSVLLTTLSADNYSLASPSLNQHFIATYLYVLILYFNLDFTTYTPAV